MKDKSVKMKSDGKYHWDYELNMLTHPAPLLDAFWVLAISMAIAWAFVVLINLFDGDPLTATLRSVTLPFLLITAALALIVTAVYLVFAFLSHGRNKMHFVMDEGGIVNYHIDDESPQQVEAAPLSALTSRWHSTLRRGPLCVAFADVRSVKAKPRQHLIKLRGLLTYHRVYMEADDYDSVFDYICQHCPQAKH